MKHSWEVVVGKLGRVHSGSIGTKAIKTYGGYVYLSKENYGKIAGEPVTLFKDGKIHKEYFGTLRGGRDR